MARITTINDHNAPWQSNVNRTCPGMRFIWPFKWSTFDPRGRTSFDARMRRIYMITIITTSTIAGVFMLCTYLWRGNLLSFVLGLGMDAVAFIFIGWCLFVIGEAEGERTVLGTTVGRWRFDAFLLVSAMVHIMMLIARLSGNWVSPQGIALLGISSVWTLMWLLYVGVAWVASWKATDSASLA